MSSELKTRITDALKDAMRAKDKQRLGTLRLVTAAIKQIEVDERIEVDDERLLQVLQKMIKQRRDSITQYNKGGRPELAAVEAAEVAIIQEFMPEPLSDDELAALIDSAIADSGAASMKDMGKVMGRLKPAVEGRADMGALSGRIKARLGG